MGSAQPPALSCGSASRPPHPPHPRPAPAERRALLPVPPGLVAALPPAPSRAWGCSWLLAHRWPQGPPRQTSRHLAGGPSPFPHSPAQAAPLLAHGVSFRTESRLLGVGPGRHTRGTPCCLSKHWADWFLVGPMRSRADGGLSGMLLGGSIRNPQHSLLGHFCHPR